jgi:acyl-CoA synthetase (NDP forming)
MARTEHPLARLFAPRGIALIGATDRSFWSQIIFLNFELCGYTGDLYLVNRRGTPAHGRTSFASARDIGEPVDVAYIFVPVEAVAEAIEDAGQAGIKAVVVLTSGFAEAGEAGLQLQEEVLAAARRHGMILLGPNSLGFVNLAARIPVSPIRVMHPVLPPAVALVSQSGATAIDIYDFAQQENIGLSFIAATGNEAQIDLAQIVDYLVDHAPTKGIAVFAETIRNPRAFAAAAERARAAAKPIVILKVGRSPLSAAVAKAHTGSLVGDDTVFDAACRRFGVIRVSSCEDLILTAGLLAATGKIARPGVFIASISGGACTLIADRAADEGVVLPALAPETATGLREILPSYATPLNPLDVTGAAVGDATIFNRTIEVMARDPAAGLIGICMTPPNAPRQANDAILAAISAGARAVDTPVVLISTHLKNLNDFSREVIARDRLPFVIGGLDHAIRAFGKAAWWSAQLPRPAAAIEETEAAGARPESERATLDHLAGFGVKVIPARLVTSAAQAVAAAAATGGPVALKISSPDIAHKTECGGVRLGVTGDAAVQEAFEAIMRGVAQAAPAARLDGVLVAPMRRGGLELFVGTARDPVWGPVIALGLGGIFVEALADTACALLPVTRDEVVEMLNRLRGAKLLHGFRGAQPVDLAAVADAVVRIGEAALALGPGLAALEVNPLLADGAMVEALDALAIWSDPKQVEMLA